jgi:hypothetical protein
MTNRNTKTSEDRESRGVIQTGVDIAIGGTILAFGSAAEVARDVRERVEQRIEEVAQQLVDETKDALSSPDTRPYDVRTVDEIRTLASERGIEGRSTMNKEELIHALRS